MIRYFQMSVIILVFWSLFLAYRNYTLARDRDDYKAMVKECINEWGKTIRSINQ